MADISDAAAESKQLPRQEERKANGRMAATFETIPEETRRSLGERLKRAIDGEVRFDMGSRALYATDASNYRQVPLGVIIPRSIEDIVTTAKFCSEVGAPLLPRGGGTSLAGEGCNTAVLFDCSKYLRRILWLDPQKRLAKVEPGCVLDSLRKAAEAHHLTFGPDPSTHDHNTLGGMLGNNSCGVHSIMAGRTSDNVDSLDILTYDGFRMTVGRTGDEELKKIIGEGGRRGAIYKALDDFRNKYGDLIRKRYPKIPRRVSGYENLDELLPEKHFNVARTLVGTEATCVTILSATLNLVPSPPARVLAIVGFGDIFAAADAVPDILRYGPIGLEGMDELLIDFVKAKHFHPEDLHFLPDGKGWLIAEFGADSEEEAAAAARRMIEEFRGKGNAAKLLTDMKEQKAIWELREAGLPVTAHVKGEPESWPGWEDSAVPREALGRYLRDLEALFHKHGYKASVYGHFGDGLIHCRVPFNLRTEKGLANWQAFLDEAADLVVRYGGSISGEHGDGQARGALIEKMYGAELIQAFREFKAIWDPEGRMNPGKVIDPFPITSNLRVGPSYQPVEVDHFFAYKEDEGSFTRATRRCVGVGSCRRSDSDKSVMCPSYMVTREEKHSTRGRARLLFEMIHGSAITEGWRSKAIEGSLDLCLGCKGCKSDCPVHVDMATYKAEFRAHYYAGRIRPRAAYSMGLIHRWARVAENAPRLANFLTQAPGLSAIAKWAGGVSQSRTLPAFAGRSFVHWFRSRPTRPQSERRVLLWPDTFNNHFRPQTAIAATEALEMLGYEVVIPRDPVCCGRPLYDWGFLDQAKALWRKNIEILMPEIRAGTPIVGLEPACISAFRDELPALFAGDERAQALARNARFLTEFLDPAAIRTRLFAEKTSALVQIHCHQHAVLDMAAERRVLERLGLDYEILSSGCCGMAGSFGYESKKQPLSIALAERVLLPRLRSAPAGTLIISNGFSCREQIEQACGKRALHVAELMAGRLQPV